MKKNLNFRNFNVFFCFVALGFVVFAGCLTKDKGSDGVRQLDEEGASTGRLITVQLNVTSDEEIKAAAETIKAKLPSHIKVQVFCHNAALRIRE